MNLELSAAIDSHPLDLDYSRSQLFQYCLFLLFSTFDPQPRYFISAYISNEPLGDLLSANHPFSIFRHLRILVRQTSHFGVDYAKSSVSHYAVPIITGLPGSARLGCWQLPFPQFHSP
jgi:hypothetical protein